MKKGCGPCRKARMQFVQVQPELHCGLQHRTVGKDSSGQETEVYSQSTRQALCAADDSKKGDNLRGLEAHVGHQSFYGFKCWFCFDLIVTVPWFVLHGIRKYIT